MDENGHYSGYAFDYLQELARYTGWEYEFVDASWSDCLSMLERGELDLLGAVMRSPEREAVFEFGDHPMISGYGVLLTLLDNNKLPYEDFEAFNGLRIGTLVNNQQTVNFLAYSRAHDFSPLIIEYSSQEAVYAALENGEVDAAVLTNTLRSQSMRVVATFGETNAYFVTTKGNTQILTELNKAMRQLRLKDPYFNQNLNRKHYDLEASPVISFTREELNFIEQSPPIPCVYIPEALPFSYYDKKTDCVQGISADICKVLEERTGLTFTWINPATATEAVEMLRRGDALLLPAQYHDLEWAWRNNLVLTEPYIQGQMVMVEGEHTATTEIVALYDQASQSRLVAKAVSDGAQFQQYGTVLDCVEAVSGAEATAAFIHSTTASYLRNNPRYARLQMTPLYGFPADMCMAVSGKADPLLLSVLDKGLRSISVTETNQIVLSHMRTGEAGLLATALYLYPAETVLFISATLLALILVLLILLHNRQKNAKDMHKALYTDALTGYPNYRALTQAASIFLRQAPERYALVYMDIHRFKVINDTFGYKTGDKVLIAVSDILHAFTKSGEWFARLYADTFVLLLRYDTQMALQIRLDHLLGQLNLLPLQNADSISPLFLGGVYSLPDNFESLDQACDRASYAKDSIQSHFSSTFAFYDDVMRKRVLEEKELENRMQSVLLRGELVPYYQPKINAITGEVVGAEALTRWNHPEKGLLSPGDFLPFYEKNGFIEKIDLFIFEQVCRDLQAWTKAGNETVPVSVNFSRRHMRSDSLPEKLQEIANRYGIPASLLEVELTEMQELENLETAVAFVDGLRVCGFGVSIDDYGTGYSSISFLQKLPLDTLKLDRSFILNAMESTKARDIMRHLVAAMHQNKIRVVCEGVETQEQRDFVVGLDCRFIQGYFYSPPLPKDAFQAYLMAHGADRTGEKDFLAIAYFDKEHWHGAEDFLNRSLPSWVACCLCEPGYPVHFISPNFLADMGYSALEFEAATGGQYVNWVHPEDLPWALKQLEQREHDDQELLLQYRLRKKDGDYLWIRETNRVVLTNDNREALLCVCSDISDLISLRAEKSRLMDTIPGGVAELLLTEEGAIIQQATDYFYKVIGHSAEEMEAVGNNLCEIIYPQDLPSALEQLHGLLYEKTFSNTVRIRWPDGSLHWFSLRSAAYPTRDGIYVTVILFSSDEEMQTRRETIISEAKLELALSITGQAVFEYDIQTQVISAHSGLAAYGIPEGMELDVPGDLIENRFIHPDDAQKFYIAHQKISSGEAQTSYEIRVRSEYNHPDAPYVWLRITLTTIFDEDQQPVRAVGSVENINQEKKLKDALRQEANFRKAFTESSLMALEINLTQDTLQRINGLRAFRLRELCERLPTPNRYSSTSSIAIESLVAQEDRALYARKTSREHLLELYQNGIFEQEFEYRRMTPEGEALWNSSLTHLTLDKFSGDVMCYVYHRDIHEKKLAEQGLVEQASRDPLTGALNRAAAERLIQSYLRHCTASNRIQAFLMIDVDRFKALNDTFGHLTGDKCLLGLARTLQGQLRTDDIVARMGGDEFAVLLKNLPNENSAVSMAQKLVKAIGEIGAGRELELEISVSIGIALAPHHGMNFETLYRRADKALYRAKKTNDTHIVLYGCREGLCSKQ